ncbi:hypothetical protein BGAL_0528g00020 [Botrytis galanthina]|uniref:Uncharacterized protein n=1 Tax=Botrytis galanthina TaxID=278940 RepID=A0A4S8QWF2_9HELO|nr:hypothetical protein BGAL_0528g00020 [Botrytis galanthina]
MYLAVSLDFVFSTLSIRSRPPLLFYEVLRRQSSPERQKRLIILEDIDPRSAELLGIVLEIPPAFFISHCHTNINLSIVNKTYAQIASSRYWKIKIPGKDTLVTGCGGEVDLFAGNSLCNYGLSHLHENILRHDTAVSYWGQYHGETSWTKLVADRCISAVLLVVSPRTYLLPFRDDLRDPSRNAIHLVEDNGNTGLSNLGDWQVLLDPPDSYAITSDRECMFDFLTAAHQGSSYEYSENPFSATVYARNFVRVLWEAEISRIISVSYSMVHDSREHDGSIEAIKLIDRRIVAGYQSLIREKTALRLFRRHLALVVRAFQCERNSSSHLNCARYQTGKGDSTEEIEQESSAWRSLDKELEASEIQINQHMEEYAQRAALNEAYANRLQTFEANRQTEAANRQARSAGQLTKIATAVVPSTVVASIFSMGGNFAVGEKLFVVYWAISLPITLALLIWVLHEDISKAWSKLTVRRRFKEYESDESESETSGSESDYINSESGISDRGSKYKGSKRNWLRFLRRQGKSATIDEEKATRSHSIRERSFQTARSDPVILADNMSFEVTRPFSIRSEDGSFKTAKTNSLAIKEGSSIVSKDLTTKKRNTL